MNEIKHHLTKLRQLLSITDVNLYGVTITMSDKFIIRITFLLFDTMLRYVRVNESSVTRCARHCLPLCNKERLVARHGARFSSLFFLPADSPLPRARHNTRNDATKRRQNKFK